ncbi:DegT/DnrJ/EryC1/StrS aminotransferase family protein [Pelagibius sp. Alg239-R121]|uniref:DegT/DnrJ/EryC1/StrS family aminotransferase n=1 Tax=Pelagibius sp. Alg239-R121 TaxID=2993448 RepID=UPI0024A74F25|nr:DegT/DnrJ/EryC1/StrS family aminotransferase [Pelagibius sp. Alg239-R121]
MQTIQFIDLKAQQARIHAELDSAIDRVLSHGQYILGPEVAELERQLGAFCGAEQVVSCANGTDALTLALMAEGVGPGDAVFVPAFTFVATAEAPAQLGATPVFVDVDEESFNLDPESLKTAIRWAREAGLRPRTVIAVDLYGLSADYDVVTPIAKQEGMFVIADAAQSFGGVYHDRSIGTLADYTTTSFFPAKPLGCYGDGGAVLTASDEKAELLRSLRFHGKGDDRYDNIRIGLNSRLDTLQAAILIEKLSIFSDELDRRDRVAQRYSEAFEGLNDIRAPKIPKGYRSSWAQYTLRVTARDDLLEHCKKAGVPTAVHYPIPLAQQEGYRNYPSVPGGIPVSERLAESVVSLPMHPYLAPETQDIIIETVKDHY